MGKEDKVITALNERGFLLELQTFRKLKALDWQVELSSPYWEINLNLDDLDIGLKNSEYETTEYEKKSKTRTIDILARKRVEFEPRWITEHLVSGALIVLVIECKQRTSENWVFYREEYGSEEGRKEVPYLSEEGMHLINYLEWHRKIDILDESIEGIQRSSHHCLGEMSHVATAGVPIFGPKTKNSLYGSCEQVITALEYYVSTYQEFTNRERGKEHSILPHWRLYPIIVFDGPLWEVSLTNDQIAVNPLPWLTYTHNRNDITHFIDIVRWEAFDGYCAILEKEIQSLSTQ